MAISVTIVELNGEENTFLCDSLDGFSQHSIGEDALLGFIREKPADDLTPFHKDDNLKMLRWGEAVCEIPIREIGHLRLVKTEPDVVAEK